MMRRDILSGLVAGNPRLIRGDRVPPTRTRRVPHPSIGAMLLALIPPVVACGTAGSQVATTGESDLTVAQVAAACTEPVVSDDGAFVFVNACPSSATSPGQIVRIDAASGVTQKVADLTAGDVVLSLRSTSGRVAFLTQHASGAWDVTARDVALSQPAQTLKPAFPAGAPAADMGAPEVADAASMLLTPDGKHVVVLGGGGKRFVLVADATGTNAPSTFDLGDDDTARTLWPSAGGKVVIGGVSWPAGASSWSETVRILDVGAVTTLGSVRTLDAGLATWADTFDGDTVVAAGTFGGASVVAAIALSSGATKVLASGIELAAEVAFHDSRVWYVGRRASSGADPTLFVLEGVDRGGTTASFRIWASPRRAPTAHLSHDGTTLLFAGLRSIEEVVSESESDPSLLDWGGPRYGALFSAPASGSGPVTLVARGDEDIRWLAASSASYLITGTHLPNIAYSVRLIDDVTAADITSWEQYKPPYPPGWTYADETWMHLPGIGELGVSDSGGHVYRESSCAQNGGVGRKVTRLSKPTKTEMIPCVLSAGAGHFLLLRNSVSIVHVMPTSQSSEVLRVTILKP